MFERKKTILFITKSKIKIANVSIGDNTQEEIIAVFDWTPDTLSDVLSKFQKDIKHSARILLSEDFVYTVNVTMPSGSVSRDDIKKRAQELIPENLDETIWDFKEIGSPTTIQVVAVAKGLFETVRSAVAKVGLRIEAIESLSLALARFSKKEDKPSLYIYIDDGDILVTLAQKGLVLGTEHLTTLDVNAITQFILFAKERFNIEVRDVIFCGRTSGVDLAKFSREAGSGFARCQTVSGFARCQTVSGFARQDPNFKAQIQDISPIISLAYKEDIKGKDEEVLNLGFVPTVHLRGVVSRHLEGEDAQHLEGANVAHLEGGRRDAPDGAVPVGTPQSRIEWFWDGASRRTPSRWTGIIIIIVIIIITAIVAGFLFFQAQQKTDQTSSKPFQTKSKPSSTIVTPTASPSAHVDFSEYSVRILNGSGRVGEAAKVESILKDNGFNTAEIGNADRSDYEKTEVHHKENVPESVILGLDKILDRLYDFSISADLEEDSKSDFVIIIGSAVK